MPTLSRWAYEALDQLGEGPRPTRFFSANLLRYLAGQSLIEYADLPAQDRKGNTITLRHAKITVAGRNAFDERPES